MPELLLFAGTSEGRRISEVLSAHQIEHIVSVATEYGKSVIKDTPYTIIMDGRLKTAEMKDLAAQYCCKTVIDATHPYADVVTKHIQEAFTGSDIEYIRVVRDETSHDTGVYVETIEKAIEYLNQTNGNILLTTGSKQLHAVTDLECFEDRVYARILPDVDGIEKCKSVGIPLNHIIAMQGPFTHDLNCALIRQYDIKYLVTKDSGTSGGTADKISAANETGITTILIGRPQKEDGLPLKDVINKLLHRYECAQQIDKIPLRFPFFEDISRQAILVVGAGKIATRRVETLLEFGCEIKVIAKEISSQLQQLNELNKGLDVEKKEFEEKDISDADLVLAATNDRTLNTMIRKLCSQKRIRCNIADKKEESDFYFPAVIHYEGGIIGICGDGTDHKKTKNTADLIRRMIRE